MAFLLGFFYPFGACACIPEHILLLSHEQQASLKERMLVQLHQLVAVHRNELTAFY